MSLFPNPFDKYERTARVYPALIVGSPALVAAATTLPTLPSQTITTRLRRSDCSHSRTGGSPARRRPSYVLRINPSAARTALVTSSHTTSSAASMAAASSRAARTIK